MKKPKHTSLSPELLPFKEIDQPANRVHIRNSTCKSVGRQHYHVDYEKMRPGRNYRRKPSYMTEEEYFNDVLQIPALAEAIFINNGPVDAIIGDFLQDDELFYINDGWRRWLATGYLLKQGKTHYPNGRPIAEVEVVINPKEYTETDRNLLIFTSQNKLSLRPVENAYAFQDMKIKEPGLTNETLATRANVSRQTIDLYLKILELPEEVIEHIERGNIKYTAAIQEHKRKLSEEKKLKEPDKVVDQEPIRLPVPVPQFAILYDNDGKEVLQEEIPGGDPGDTFIDKEVIKDIPAGDGTTPKVETQKALDVEFEQRKTDPNFKEQRPKKDRNDALGKIDANAQKTEAEMDIEQAVKMLDKLEVQIGHLPTSMKQAKTDMAGLANFIRNLLIGSLDKLKRMPSGVEEDA